MKIFGLHKGLNSMELVTIVINGEAALSALSIPCYLFTVSFPQNFNIIVHSIFSHFSFPSVLSMELA
jgi:hypothetical protein